MQRREGPNGGEGRRKKKEMIGADISFDDEFLDIKCTINEMLNIGYYFKNLKQICDYSEEEDEEDEEIDSCENESDSCSDSEETIDNSKESTKKYFERHNKVLESEISKSTSASSYSYSAAPLAKIISCEKLQLSRRVTKRKRPQQNTCCIVDCDKDVNNRLYNSLKEKLEPKSNYLEKGKDRICNYHYFSNLYAYKKRKERKNKKKKLIHYV